MQASLSLGVQRLPPRSALAGKGGCEDCRDPACLRCDASSTQCTECASKRSVTEGSTPYFYYYQLDRAGKKCVRIFREKNTIPPDEYF